ncbi:amidohydrolase [bacterium]|nr:amidohydrolase [bacterium]
MDCIFYNGRINTLDPFGTVYSAVGVENGRIIKLGRDNDLKGDTEMGTVSIDLKGAAMFPGFMESHNHMSIFGYLLNGIDLSAARVSCMDDILSRVKEETEKKEPGEWIKGSRYAEYFLKENRHPRRSDLDAVSPEHPVVLFHTSFHACTLNSRALEMMDIRRDATDPQGGKIEKDPDSGEPTGVLHDQAMMAVFNSLFFADLMKMNSEERINLVAAASQKFAEVGLVFAADALVVPEVLRMYQETLAADRLDTRLYTMNYAPLADGLVESGIRTGFGSGMLRIGPIKLFADGGMSNRTAAVVQPYLTPPHDHGLKMYSLDELKANVKRYHDLGYQIAVHAQGDAGLADTLDAFETVLGTRSDNPMRHRIEHAGCLYPDLLKRAVAMHIPAAVQPVFFSELGDGFIEAFGPELAHKLYPFKSMLKAGLKIGGSSDCPVSELDPRKGLAGAVMRTTPSGAVLAPEEALTMDEALRLYTQGSAYLSFDELENGSIEPGKRADFTVMAEDPRLVKPEEVPHIPFTMTVVDGRVVWSEERP